MNNETKDNNDANKEQSMEFPLDALKGLFERPGREGLSADCTLDPMIVMAIMMSGREHPCDRCNKDRKVCRGFPRL
jgi:hypothetical protein